MSRSISKIILQTTFLTCFWSLLIHVRIFLSVIDNNWNIFLEDTDELRWTALSFSFSFVIACVLNIFAALKIWRWFSVPYILMDFVRLAVLLACHVILMMIFKKQLNLGVLIAACSIGGFFILFLCYMWSCSIAFFQIVGVVSTKDYQRLVSIRSPAPEKNLKNVSISTISSTVSRGDLPDYKHAVAGIFASDFSEYYKKSSFRN